MTRIKRTLMTLVLLVLAPAIGVFGIDSFEIGAGMTWRQPDNTYFLADSTLLEMSYSAGILWNDSFSTEIAYYSYGSDLMYFYSNDPLSADNWAGPFYRTETPPEGYDMNMGNAQMHIFDIRFGLHKRLSVLDFFAEAGPTVIIPGTIIRSSTTDDDLSTVLPEGWYEVLQQYVAETGGWLPILGANAGVGLKLYLWRVTAWGAARYRYTFGIPAEYLIDNFELSFGAGIELYRKKK